MTRRPGSNGAGGPGRVGTILGHRITGVDLARLRGRNNEGVLALVLVALVVAISVANPTFLSLPTLFAIVRSAIVSTILALGVLIVIISGGVDVSFAAIAVFAAYTTVRVMQRVGVDVGLAAAAFMALAIGTVLGLVNGALIAWFRLPTLIVTLGTQGIYQGILLTYVGSTFVPQLPAALAGLSTTSLVTVTTWSGHAFLHVMVLPAAVLCVAVALMLRATMFGRSVYALGGDQEGARRAGFRVGRTQLAIYVIVGALSAVGGVIFVIMGQNSSPRDLVGGELDIIASVVLGGASIFGGRGSVLGTVLGVLLVEVVDNSLILAGVPSAWQRTAVGVLLIIGVGVQALTAQRRKRSTRSVDRDAGTAQPTGAATAQGRASGRVEVRS